MKKFKRKLKMKDSFRNKFKVLKNDFQNHNIRKCVIDSLCIVSIILSCCVLGVLLLNPIFISILFCLLFFISIFMIIGGSIIAILTLIKIGIILFGEMKNDSTRTKR